MSMPLTYSFKKGLNNNRGETTGPEVKQQHSPAILRENEDDNVAGGISSVPMPPPPPPPSKSSLPSHPPRGRRRRAIKKLKRTLHAAPTQLQPKESREEKEEAEKGQRQVRFAHDSETDIHHVPSRSSYTSAELRSTWLTRMDLLKIKCEAGRVVAQVRRDDPSTNIIDEYSSNTITIRGLERHVSEESNEKRRVRKANVVWAVLTEQAKERKYGGCAEGRIRYASVRASAKSGEMARAAAEWDEYVVRLFAAEEEDCSCGTAEEKELVATATAVEITAPSSPRCASAYPEAEAKPMDIAHSIEVPGCEMFVEVPPPSPKRTEAVAAYFDTPLGILPSDLGCEISVDEMSVEHEISSIEVNTLPLVENSIQCQHVDQQQRGYIQQRPSIQQRLRPCDSYHWPLAEVQVRRSILCR
mmetsp:Transcript_53236/g.159382  ORF Transcript_53236/g.159382 Transcript_53236/m.159382 type:complete len:415 (-) Transcript_53236:315-1559(-)